LDLRGRKWQEAGEDCIMRSLIKSMLHQNKLTTSRRMRLAGHVARMGTMRNAYSVSVGKPEGKKPLGRHSHRWEDNIRLDLREIRWFYACGSG